MSEKHNSVIAVIGIDIGKNSFYIIGLDGRGAIALRQKWSRGQVALPPSRWDCRQSSRKQTYRHRKERRTPPDWPGARLRPECLDRRRLQRSRVPEKFIWLPLP
ncbi:unnamed protein product [uncultured bacterium]|nr:unnamed protein product [uncultured bacterium]